MAIEPIDLRNTRQKKLPEKKKAFFPVIENKPAPIPPLSQSPREQKTRASLPIYPVKDETPAASANPPQADRISNGIQKKDSFIEWSALEYTQRELGPNWFLLPGGIALVLIVISILARNYSFLGLIIIASILFFIYMKRPPRNIAVAIRRTGITIGSTTYAFSELKSFWIFDRGDDTELSLETHKALTPFIQIPLAATNPETVREILLQFLPEREHEESMTDAIARKIGF